MKSLFLKLQYARDGRFCECCNEHPGKRYLKRATKAKLKKEMEQELQEYLDHN